MKKFKKRIILDFLYVFVSILLFREKCFPFVGFGIIVLGVLLFQYFNQKPN